MMSQHMRLALLLTRVSSYMLVHFSSPSPSPRHFPLSPSSLMGLSLPNFPKQKSSRDCQDDYGFSCDNKICNNTKTWRTELTACCMSLGKVLFPSLPYCVLPDNQCLNTGWSCNPNVKFPLRPEVTLPAKKSALLPTDRHFQWTPISFHKLHLKAAS